MFARASRFRGNVEQGIERYREGLLSFRKIEGNQGVFLLLHRAEGKGIGVTLWESEEAMTNSPALAPTPPEGPLGPVEEYEVAVWEVGDKPRMTSRLSALVARSR